MKTNWTLLIGLFITVNLATAQDTLYIYQGGAELYKTETSTVDSITFSYLYPGTFPYDGFLYHYITIGTQTWMVENLRTTHYRNGDAITTETDNTVWKSLLTGAWCDYNNNAANGAKYGHLYNWYAVDDNRNIAPPGWHVPSDAEWSILTNYLATNFGTSLNATKALAAKTDWTISGPTGAVGNNLTINNSSRFTALPAGIRSYTDNGIFSGIGSNGYWWSSTSSNATNAIERVIMNQSALVFTYNYNKANGLSIRCLKD